MLLRTRDQLVTFPEVKELHFLTGDWDIFVVLEFPDAAAARAWYDSPGYLAARDARAGAAVMEMTLVEGYLPAAD